MVTYILFFPSSGVGIFSVYYPQKNVLIHAEQKTTILKKKIKYVRV